MEVIRMRPHYTKNLPKHLFKLPGMVLVNSDHLYNLCPETASTPAP